MSDRIVSLMQQVLPKPARTVLRRWWIRSPFGRARFGVLRRRKPYSRNFGFDRGLPIDRFYIERFLAAHSHDIRGGVLEFGDATYTHRFGGERVVRTDVVFPNAGNPEATIVADLAAGDTLPESAFDCIICTQTLHLFFDPARVARILYQALRPGGVLLVSLPGISQISDSRWREDWYWGFTGYSARRLFAEVAGAAAVAVEVYGNLLTTTAYLHGAAAEEIHASDLEHRDPDYHLLMTVRVAKPGTEPQAGSETRPESAQAAARLRGEPRPGSPE